MFYRPSPSLKQTQLAVPGVPGVVPVETVDEGTTTAERGVGNREDYVSTGSLAGSIASTSSGFGSLPKKRPALFTSGKYPFLNPDQFSFCFFFRLFCEWQFRLCVTYFSFLSYRNWFSQTFKKLLPLFWFLP